MACSVESGFRARIAASIVYRGKVVAYGYNHRKSHPFQSKYSSHPKSYFFHAEVHAIHNALKLVDVGILRKSTIFVARAKWQGDHKHKKFVYGLARPCRGCFRCIEDYEIKEIVFTTDDEDRVKIVDSKSNKGYG